jgi:hypothetical protein
MQSGTATIKIRQVGGGGGGGGAETGANSAAAGGGGSAGSYAERWLTGITGGGSYTFNNGAGGAGGSSAGGSGGTGGDTKFETSPSSGSYHTCPGGSGGVGMQPTTTPLFAKGGHSGVNPSSSGALVYGVGQSGEPGIAIDGNNAASGNGGVSYLGSGGEGNTAASSGNAPTTANYGGGGSGGLVINGSGHVAGGAGTPGCQIVEEYS